MFFSALLSRNNKESRRFIKIIVDIIAIFGQATGFVIWPIVEFGRGNTKTWLAFSSKIKNLTMPPLFATYVQAPCQ